MGVFYPQTLSMRLSLLKSFPKTLEIGEFSPFLGK
jgi:hypothetical protein